MPVTCDLLSRHLSAQSRLVLMALLYHCSNSKNLKVVYSQRYGEKSTPFCVTQLEGQKRDGEFSRRINNAVERASSDYHSGTSSDEEGGNTSMSSSVSSSNSSSLSVPEPKCIPTVSNPNSVYQVTHSQFPLFSPLSCT